jgi:hypothetical protein
MFIRIRTIKGNQYRYAEERWREGRRVRSRSIYLGGVNRTNEGWLRRQLGHRYGNLTEEEQEKHNARCQKDAAERQALLNNVHDNSGSRLASNVAVPAEKVALDFIEHVEITVMTDSAEESPADEGEAEAQ